MDSLTDIKENLDQSIRLLSQQNSQRRTFLRLSGQRSTPRRISLQATSQSRKDADDGRQTVGDTHSPGMVNRTAYPIGTKLNKLHNVELDMSLTLSPHEIRDIMMRSERNDITIKEMMEDSTATGAILKANEPWREVKDKLYYDFLQSVQAHFSEAQVFDTIADFIQNCTDTLDIMRGMQSKVENTEIAEEEISLESERNTWRLIYCLYQNRISSANLSTQMEHDGLINNNYISEKDVIENLYKSESYIREYQLIIDWLEKNALDQADKYPSIELFTDKTVAWENTVHQLHNQNLGIAFSSSRPLVSSLDPDAPIREGRPLHDLDREDDARLEKRMFIEVRCGRLQKAQALAMHCGQPWRAACLLGWIPNHDPNYSNPLTDTKLPIEGNPNRSLWKMCAWELSQDKRIGVFYRAIYASLCGNVQLLLQIASSWQDALWAYVKSLLDIKVESALRLMMVKIYTVMPEEYWKNEISLEDAFKELHASKNPIIRAQSIKPDHLIQKYIILDQIPKLMEEIESMIDGGTCTDSQFLRFLTHLILFFRQIGKSTKDKVEDKVLLSYVRVLIEMGDPTLIAFYTATLPQEDQITNYASYLESVKEHEQRKKCLRAAEDANLNVEAITKLVVENIRKKNIESDPTDLKGTITEADMEKINGLDWLIFYQSQREEALRQTNALIRYFLTNEKIDAARKAFNKIPSDSIESVMSEYPTMNCTLNLTITNNLSKKASATIREYLCYKTYLDAQEGFGEWFSHYHHGKPTPPEELPTYATFTEKVAYDHRKTQYNSELERWKSTMQHHTKAVKQLLFNVLLFPDGGWLVDSKGSNDEPCTPEDELREHQLEKLRELCIPKVTLLLHSVMSEMNEHDGCIQLADVLASEQYQLYKVFSKGRLREVFKKICESSLVLMDQKKDPWGYPK